MLTPSQKRALKRKMYGQRESTTEEFNEQFGLSNFNTAPVRQIGGKVRSRRVTKQRPPYDSELEHWRESVLLRDGYKCVECGSPHRLEVDHIKPKSMYPELRYEITNGRTLCHNHHQQTETYGRRVRRLVTVTVE